MANVAISGDTSGAITLSAPAVAGTNTITLPASTYTMFAPMADYWCLDTGFSNTSGSETYLTTNLSRFAGNAVGTAGSSLMTQSSGVFTFPTTGLYRVNYFASFYSSSNISRYVIGHLYTTTNAGSTWSRVGVFPTSLDAIVSSANTFVCGSCEVFINVTNTANVQVKFSVETQATINVQGTSSESQTIMSFLRIA
jgi:hypothetical protein